MEHNRAKACRSITGRNTSRQDIVSSSNQSSWLNQRAGVRSSNRQKVSLPQTYSRTNTSKDLGVSKKTTLVSALNLNAQNVSQQQRNQSKQKMKMIFIA
mmetsp:Transcript_3/g.7  ORF Transcript_3/g.7 Transcript_3/m.7 type:complete len:99 (-) Transcript_3:33-329(-)